MLKKISEFLVFVFISVIVVNTNAPIAKAIENNSPEIVTVNGVDVKVQTLIDNNGLKKVLSEDDKAITTTTFNKKTNIISVEQVNKITGEKIISITDLNKVQTKKANEENSSIITTLDYTYIVDSGIPAFFDARYFYWSDRKWGIYNSDESVKYVYETSSNSDDLLAFRDSVNDIIGGEIAAVAAGGVAVVSASVAVLTAPTGLGAVVGVVTAIGGTFTCAVALWDAYQASEDADFYWSRVS